MHSASESAAMAANTTGSGKMAGKKFDPMAGFEPGATPPTFEEPRGEVGFTSDIDANMGLIQELISGLTRDKGNRAMIAAKQIEKVVVDVMNLHKGDAASSLGITFAIHKIAKLLVQGDKANQDKGQGLIQLLQ
jgi:hypothetical protein